MEHLSGFSDVELQGCQNLLHNNFIPYEGIGEDNSDEELVWCTVKNNNLKGDQKFALMYRKDKENRQAILNEINKRIELLATNKTEKVSFETLSTINKDPQRLFGFLDILTPTNGSIENTLEYIESKIIEARFPLQVLGKSRKRYY